VRTYLRDEPDHAALRNLLFDASHTVVTSELSRVELASAAASAERVGRVRRLPELLHRMDADAGPGGPIRLLTLRPNSVFPAAQRLVLEHPMRALDAIHLAVAVQECP